MILIGLGGNLPSRIGDPRQTLQAALGQLERRGLTVLALSRPYESAPVPPSDQPWFVNAVARIETGLPPLETLAVLHAVEARLGRVRTARNAARVVDLDLLAFGDEVIEAPGLSLPHPRLHERAFVLRPLAEVAPGWRHPVSGHTVEALIRALPAEQIARPTSW